MAKRTKQQSILEIALAGNWRVSAFMTAALAVLVFIMFPLLNNPLLMAFALGVKPLLLILIAIFALIALIKFLAQQKVYVISNNSKANNGDWQPGNEIAPAPVDVPFQRNRNVDLEKPVEWSLKFIQSIEWKRFEELSTAYYKEKGIRAEATFLGADGGIDIKLYQDDGNKPTAIVQCKAWSAKAVGVKEVREFLGVMSHEKIEQGFYITSGTYTTEAKQIAEANQIRLITGEMLLMMIQRLPIESQKKLLALASVGDYTTPSCPSCGIKMAKRSSKNGDFWGCKNYPQCRRTLRVKHSST